MDPISEQGLADPSLHHGCSTDSTGDWTVIGKKNNLNKNKNKNFNKLTSRLLQRAAHDRT